MFTSKQLTFGYVGLIAFLYIGSCFLPENAASMPAPLKVENPAATTLDYLKSIVQMATALNTAILAGTGAIAIKGKDWSATWAKADVVLLVLVLAGVTVSYYGIYMGHVETLSMVSLGYFNPDTVRMQLSLGLEYYGILFSVGVLGLVFTRMLVGRKV
jgi:hypothetical protein